MRLSSDIWGSGPREFGITEGHRSFSVTTGPDTLTSLAACGCPGCLTSIERKLINIDTTSPQGEDTRTDGGGLQFDETSGVDSVGNTTGAAVALAIGSSTNGWVNTAGDDDWYAVTLVAGQSYTFSMESGTLSDAYLEIRNSSGTIIGFDDDFGDQYNATIRWTATESGTYYINARAWEPDPGEGAPTLTGSYTLSAVTSAPASPLDAIDYHFTMPTTSISIWFATTGYTNPSGDAVVRNWTQPEIDAVMAALGTYSAITPLTFSIAPSQGGATWIFSLADLPGNTLGYFAVGANYSAFDPNVADFTAGLTPGGNSWVTIIHEAGHGLGMAHPHDNGAEDYGNDNSEVMQGVTGPFDSLGTFNLNQGVFTTMTYNDGFRSSGFGGPPSNLAGGQATPMALDVALMQQRYGVNNTTGAGNTAYTMALAHSAYVCIWDVSGTDGISYAGAGNATIDLRAATLLNAVGGGGYVSYVHGVHGGFTIANGVVIENATSGSGADTLIGNDANNILDGGAGIDNMSGGAGNDTYMVDNTSDVVVEGVNAGTDTVISTATYALQANIENLTIAGASERHGTGNALNNVLIGNSNVNSLQGLAGNDHLVGNGGNDLLAGGDGNDILDGGTGADRIDGGAGDDLIYFDAGDQLDFVLGGPGNDLLVFTSGAAPTSFNLVAQGFETAEGRFIDSGANPWATQVDFYDNQWRLDRTDVTNDNGTRSVLDYDQINAETWASIYLAYDLLNRLDVDETLYDDGSRAVLDYDQAGATSWVTTWASYNSTNQLDTDVVTYDDNSRAVRDFDQDNAFSWQITWASYLPSGVLDIDVFTYDDGSTAVRDLDQDDAFDWDTAWASYDSLGRLDTDVITYDDGSQAIRDLDQAGEFSWSQMWWLYDSNGVLIAHQVTPDGGGSIFGGP
ncbi:MAG: pre-peptidase C-terminal domain-containing protein [Hyphomonadaceae bacterium]